MNLWHTSNELSQAVMAAIAEGNQSTARHIRDFNTVVENPSAGDVFYGILRGCGTAMRICKWIGSNYHYIDNGYFDAEYVDDKKRKSMTGAFRVVKNDMIEPYQGKRLNAEIDVKRRCLLVPPSPYTANFYDTTPEDWTQEIATALFEHNIEIILRDKSSTTPLDEQLRAAGFVVSFNSMIGVEAIKRGIPAYDTHGLFRNALDIYNKDFRPRLAADYAGLREYYEPKQFTLEEFKQGKWKP